MEALMRVIGLLTIPIALLNLLGGIVSGIWLAILGEWGSIGYGLLATIFGSFIISIAMLPELIFAIPAVALLEKGHTKSGAVVGTLTASWTMIVITVWCCIALFIFAKRSDSSSFIPHMIWAYGVAVGPITYMAQKELQSGNWHSTFTAFFAQVAVITAILVIALVGMRLIDALVLIAAFMFVGLAIQTYMSFLEERDRRAFRMDY